MAKARRILPVLLFLFLPRAALSEQPINWESSIDNAKTTARQSNRLVMVFFSAPWCQACHRLESDLRNQPGVVAALEANFVPVKMNYDYFVNTAKRYGVTRLPTTVILAPTAQGEVLAVIPEAMEVDVYLSKLNKIADDFKRRNAGAFAQIQASPAVGSAAAMTSAPARPVAPTQPVNPFASAAASGPMQNATLGAGPLTGNAATTPAGGPALPGGRSLELSRPVAVAAPPSTPSLGLDGYCPVQLVEKGRWQKGNRSWGVIHRGKVYLFAGSDERRRFLADPDRFAPVNSGNDIVLALEQGRALPGVREHGAQFEGHVYLFIDESTLEKFRSNPHYYADRALQVIRQSAQTASVR